MTEGVKNKAKLARLLFIFSCPLLIWFVILQVLLHITLNWESNAPLILLDIPLFVLALALSILNLTLIQFHVIPESRRHNLSFDFYSLNIVLGSLTTSVIALGYYLITGSIIFTILLDAMAAAYTVWIAIAYGRQFMILG